MSGLGGLALLAAVLAPLAAAAVAAIPGRPHRVTPAAVLGAATAAALATAAATLAEPVEVGAGRPWALGADRPAAVLLLAALVVGWVATTQVWRSRDEHEGRERLAARAGLLVAGTALVAVGAAPASLALGWVLSGAALVGLLAPRGAGGPAGAARRRVAATFAVGDVAVVAALVLLGSAAGGPGGVGLPGPDVAGLRLDLAAVLLVVAGAARSALVPFHRWPAPTIAAPTPVSVLLHAGVIGGVGVLVLRTAPVVLASPVATHLLLVLGALTVVVGTAARRRRVDTKGELAWSTVAQMGFLAGQAAVGAMGGVVLHLVGHGLYKASRFLHAGDAPLDELARRRRPDVGPRLGEPLGAAVAAALPAAGLAGGWLLVDPGLEPAGTLLVGTFAWATGFQVLRSALAHTPATTRALAPLLVLGALVPAGYVAALAGAKALLGPDLPEAGPHAVGPTGLLVVAGAGLAVSAAVGLWPGRAGDRLRRRLATAARDLAEERPDLPAAAPPRGAPHRTPTTSIETELA